MKISSFAPIVLGLLSGLGCSSASDPAPAPTSTSGGAPPAAASTTETPPAPGETTTTPPNTSTDFVHDPGLEGAPFSLTDAACQKNATQIACQDVVFSKVGGVDLHLNLFAPLAAQTSKVPLIVFIHGGGWALGTYKQVGLDVDSYIAKGWAVASIEYRLTLGANHQPTGIKFPDNIQDVKTAIRWFKTKAAAFIEPTKIVSYGFSAGAHLSSLLATTANVKEFDGRGDPSVPVNVAGSVCLSAAFDFHVFVPDNPALAPECAGRNTKPDDDKAQELVPLLIGGDINDPANAPKLDALNSARYVDASSAPMITFNGTCDQTQPYQSVFDLQKVVEDKGLTQVETHIVPLAIHGSTLSNAAEKTALATFMAARLSP